MVRRDSGVKFGCEPWRGALQWRSRRHLRNAAPRPPRRVNIGAVFGFFGAFTVATWVTLCVRRYERR